MRASSSRLPDATRRDHTMMRTLEPSNQPSNQPSNPRPQASADAGDHRGAIELYVAALQTRGLRHTEVALNNLALSFEHLGMYDRASAAVNATLKQLPPHDKRRPQLHRRLGEHAARLGAWEQAALNLGIACSSPEVASASLASNYGRALLNMRDPTGDGDRKAVDAFMVAAGLTKDPGTQPCTAFAGRARWGHQERKPLAHPSTNPPTTPPTSPTHYLSSPTLTPQSEMSAFSCTWG